MFEAIVHDEPRALADFLPRDAFLQVKAMGASRALYERAPALDHEIHALHASTKARTRNVERIER